MIVVRIRGTTVPAAYDWIVRDRGRPPQLNAEQLRWITVGCLGGHCSRGWFARSSAAPRSAVATAMPAITTTCHAGSSRTTPASAARTVPRAAITCTANQTVGRSHRFSPPRAPWPRCRDRSSGAAPPAGGVRSCWP